MKFSWKVALGSGAAAYTSWLALRPSTAKELEHWNSEHLNGKDHTVRVYRRLPLNAISRLWGHCHQLPLPEFLRSPTYRLYSRVCACNLEEADFTDLRQFRNLSEFFRRDLKPHVRPVCQSSDLTAPADGTILHFGRVKRGQLEQVKGVTYTLQGFLGPRPLMPCSQATGATQAEGPSLPMETRMPDSEYHDLLKQHADHELYHCVIYLSPGDYHKFHSPANWVIGKRRHFPGFLLSVSPRVAQLVRGLFCINERAVYLGRWKHGFFSYTAVGATNVGSIRVFKDELLKTNQRQAADAASFHDKSFGDFSVAKGEIFGEFNLGSTIVLLFEAPKDFRFALEPGQKIRVGQSVGSL